MFFMLSSFSMQIKSDSPFHRSVRRICQTGARGSRGGGGHDRNVLYFLNEPHSIITLV